MDKDLVTCGYFYNKDNDKHYVIAVDRNFKKHYFYKEKDQKEVNIFEREELDKIFDPDYGSDLPKPKNGFLIPTGIPPRYMEYFVNFTRKVESILLSFGLDFSVKIRRNFRSISIIDDESSCFEGNIAVGIYDSKYNRLFINPLTYDNFQDMSYKSTFNHELFHGITARRDLTNMAVGFYHVKENLGIGLTEFATQHFIYKFFDGKEGYYGNFDKELMDKLLSIIGYPNFLKYMFNNDTKGLIQHIANYIGLDEAIRLMLLIDNYYYALRNFNESKMLVSIAEAFSSDLNIIEIYKRIDLKVNADNCINKYEKSIISIIAEMKEPRILMNDFESEKAL